jgi:hypothetical protein
MRRDITQKEGRTWEKSRRRIIRNTEIERFGC